MFLEMSVLAFTFSDIAFTHYMQNKWQEYVPVHDGAIEKARWEVELEQQQVALSPTPTTLQQAEISL